MTTEENPTITTEELSVLQKKIEANQASIEDYNKLQYFLSAIGISKDFLLNFLREQNIKSFEEYILERKNTSPNKNRAVDGVLLGNMLGAITALKDYAERNKL